MYKFIDTNETQTGNALPAEALQINGAYIENLIDGYRTLYVEGRDLLPSDIIIDETDTQNGGKFRNKRYLPRTLRITFQMVQKTNKEYRDAFNKLNGILNIQNAELIFNDEPDMCFVGTPGPVGDITPGANAIIGEFEILCDDPFKYSVTEVVEDVSKQTKEIEINYTGTYPAYPEIEAIVEGDLGFVSFFNERGGAIQIGNPEEVDGVTHSESKTLLDYLFTEEKYNKYDWSRDVAFPVNAMSAWTQEGAVEIKPGKDVIRPSSYGVATEGWHGPSITKLLPPDAEGHYPKNWTMEWTSCVFISDPDQYGDVEFLVTGKNERKEKVNIAAVAIWKTVSGFRGHYTMYSQGSSLRDIEIDNIDLPDRPFYNYRISKFGDELEFSNFNGTFQFKIPEIKNIEATEISILFGAHASAKPFESEVRSIRFRNHEAAVWEDVLNTFSNRDRIVAYTDSAEIFVSDLPEPWLGAISNEWDKFALQPGINRIRYSYSSWAKSPIVRIKYRKVMI